MYLNSGTSCTLHETTAWRRPANFCGYSLVEVLVALLVLSIGLLGLAALQTTGMKFNHQSYARTQAAFQTYDIVDRMRVNKTGSGGTAYATYDDIDFTDLPTITTNCESAACTQAELATFDINKWKVATAALLPSGQAAICRGTFNATFTTCTAGGSIYHIVVQWQETDLTVTFQVQTQL